MSNNKSGDYTTVYSGTGDDTFIFEVGVVETHLNFYNYNGFDENATIVAGKGNNIITLSTTGNEVYNHVMGDGNVVLSFSDENKLTQLTINIESTAKYTGSDYLV